MHGQSTPLSSFCACGCGQPTALRTKGNFRKGIVKGQPSRFVVGHYARAKFAGIPEYLIDLISGCWIWQRAVDAYGYGTLKIDGRNVMAHRAVFERHRGPIPVGLTLDHVCHTNDAACVGGRTCLHRPCVNPWHMEPVTKLVNDLRGRSFRAVNAAKAHCARGHEFTEANIYRTAEGSRACRACHREAERIRRLRRQTR
jgi:hypothetical protein